MTDPVRSRLPEDLRKIAGGLSYSSPPDWVWSEDGPRLVLAPRRWPHPAALFWVVGGVPAFCAAIYLALRGRAQVSEGLLLATCIVIPVLTILALAVVHELLRRRGPYLVHDADAGTLELCRHGVVLADDEVHLVQTISGVLGQGGSSPSRVAEVNVITVDEPEGGEGEPVWRRYGLVGTHDPRLAREAATVLKRRLGKLPAEDEPDDGA